MEKWSRAASVEWALGETAHLSHMSLVIVLRHSKRDGWWTVFFVDYIF